MNSIRIGSLNNLAAPQMPNFGPKPDAAEAAKAQNNVISGISNGQDMAEAHAGLDPARVARLLSLCD